MPVNPAIILYDVVGRPAGSDGILFVAALFEFKDGRHQSDEFELDEFDEERAIVEQTLRQIDHGAFDSGDDVLAWTRARLNAVFEISVPDARDDSRDQVIDAPLIAVVLNDGAGPALLPFICRGGGCGSSPELIFAANEGRTRLKQEVANAFWKLLAREPFELRPFQLHLFDDYEGIRYQVGYDGQRFYSSSFSFHDEKPICEIVPDYFPVEGERVVCPTCNGTGEESFFPAGAMCETCQGWGEFR